MLAAAAATTGVSYVSFCPVTPLPFEKPPSVFDKLLPIKFMLAAGQIVPGTREQDTTENLN